MEEEEKRKCVEEGNEERKESEEEGGGREGGKVRAPESPYYAEEWIKTHEDKNVSVFIKANPLTHSSTVLRRPFTKELRNKLKDALTSLQNTEVAVLVAPS